MSDTKNQAVVVLDTCSHCPLKKHTGVLWAGAGLPKGKHPVCTGCEAPDDQEYETNYTGKGRVLPRRTRDMFGHGVARKEWFDTNVIPDWCPKKKVINYESLEQLFAAVRGEDGKGNFSDSDLVQWVIELAHGQA